MGHKFINRNKKLALSQVNLKEYFEFYRDFICSYNYLYTLEDGTEIELKFNEKNFSHLLGLHKFKRVSSYNKSQDINDDILNNKLIFKTLLVLEPKIFTDELRDRITYFPVLRTLLENITSALKYDLNIIWNSKVEFSFLLHSDKITILVYLAVKEIKGNRKICVPVSLLVDRNERFSKLGLKKLQVVSSQIVKK